MRTADRMNDWLSLRDQLLERERGKYRLALARAHAAMPSETSYGEPQARADAMAERATAELLPFLVAIRREIGPGPPLTGEEVAAAHQARAADNERRIRENAVTQAVRAKAPPCAAALLARPTAPRP
jgi:hypothetical protein